MSRPQDRPDDCLPLLSFASSTYLYLGASGGVDPDTEARLPRSFVGKVGVYSSQAVSGARDVNGDGYSDVLVGTPLTDSSAGSAYVFVGPPCATTWYADADADGYGDALDGQAACDQPSGYLDNADDCDDSDPGVSPDSTELCNSIDDDCDGEIDEDCRGDGTQSELAGGGGSPLPLATFRRPGRTAGLCWSG